MAQDDLVTYVKLSRDGEPIERDALTPQDHVQLRGTGWVRKDSSLGRQVTNPKKGDSAEGQPATSVTAHAAAAQKAEPASATKASAKD